MRPDVYAFVMDHEQTLEDAGWSVEVNPIPVCNVGVILHKLRSLLQIPNEMRLLLNLTHLHVPSFLLLLSGINFLHYCH